MKKLIALLISAVTACMTVPASAAAIFNQGSEEYVRQYAQEYYPYQLEDPDEGVLNAIECATNKIAFINENANDIFVAGKLRETPYLAVWTNDKSKADALGEAVNQAAAEFSADSKVDYLTEGSPHHYWRINNISDSAAKQVYNTVKDIDGLEGASYTGTTWTYNTVSYFRNVLTYTDHDFSYFDVTAEELNDFAEANGMKLEYGVQTYTYCDEITPYYEVVTADGSELDPVQKYEFSQRISKELGLKNGGISPAVVNSIGINIDMFGAVMGDANNDSSVNLNDAVAVLQFIALPEKYPLDPQQQFNADCDGNDGLSGGDALWIQQKDAGIV